MRRRYLAPLLLLAPGLAVAHSPMQGIGNFYGGILHPILVPSHLLALLSLGLLIGQSGVSAMRLAYPDSIRVVRLPCTGKLDVAHVLASFEHGADAVMVAG